MLQEMRKYAKSWVASIFLGGLALSFGLWGIADIFRGNVDTTVAAVGDSKISVAEFQRDYRNEIRNRSAKTGTQITPEMARAAGLGQQVLQRSVIRTALDNMVHSLGLAATDASVSSEVRSIDAFKGPLGSFDRNMFERQLQAAGYSEDEFLATVRTDAARSQLLKPLEGGFEMPGAYAAALFAFQNESRAANYVVVSPVAVAALPAPNDAQLNAYLKAHSASFSTPEYRQVTYAWLSPEDFMSKVHVSNAQIQQAYDEQKATYQIPEKRDLEQISYPTQADAAAAKAKIDAGGSFAAAAFARGFKPTEITLGSLAKADLEGDRANAAFSLPVGGVSSPVKGPFGWVLLHVVKITPGVSKTLADVKPELTKKIGLELASSKLVDAANAYQDAAGGGASLAEAAKKVGMHVVHLPAVDANGLGPDGKKLIVPQNPELLAQIFKSEVGEEGDPFQTKDGSSYVVKVEGVTPPKLKPINSVRAQVTQEWTEQQRQTALATKAKALAAQANSDKSLTHIAAGLHAAVQLSPGLLRGSVDQTFSPALLQEIFASPAGTAVYGPSGKGDSYVIALVTGVAHRAPPVDDPRYRNGRARLGNLMAQDLTQSMAAAARDKQGAKVYPEMVERVIGGGAEGS